MLCLYKRIFRGHVFNAITWFVISCITIWGVASFFGIIFQCVPIPRYLEDPSDPNLHCVDDFRMYHAHAVIDVVFDFIILILPWPFIWQLKMPIRRKLAAMLSFFFGCL